MKKVLSLLAVAGLVAAASSAFGATIVGSKHDLSKTGTASMSGTGSSTQICVYCHAPHNANLSLPLWNRTNPTATFRLYSGVNMQNVSFASSFTADSTSLFCMSCHDGTTAMNAVHNAGTIEAPGGAIDATAGQANARRTVDNALNIFAAGAIGATKNTALGGTNLTKTHPINFAVSTVDGQSDLHVPNGIGAKMGKTGYEMPLFKLTGNRVTDRSLECGSCHAVHDSANSPFLRYTMDGSKLCLGCHNK